MDEDMPLEAVTVISEELVEVSKRVSGMDLEEIHITSWNTELLEEGTEVTQPTFEEWRNVD